MSLSQQLQKEAEKLHTIELNLRENIRRILLENKALSEENKLLKARIKYIKQLFNCQQGIISKQFEEIQSTQSSWELSQTDDNLENF